LRIACAFVGPCRQGDRKTQRRYEEEKSTRAQAENINEGRCANHGFDRRIGLSVVNDAHLNIGSIALYPFPMAIQSPDLDEEGGFCTISRLRVGSNLCIVNFGSVVFHCRQCQSISASERVKYRRNRFARPNNNILRWREAQSTRRMAKNVDLSFGETAASGLSVLRCMSLRLAPTGHELVHHISQRRTPGENPCKARNTCGKEWRS
jgi:hypothetical protein